MINFIVGPKGSGKTKKLIKLVNEAADISLGNVVCIEKTPNLVGNISRLCKVLCGCPLKHYRTQAMNIYSQLIHIS